MFVLTRRCETCQRVTVHRKLGQGEMQPGEELRIAEADLDYFTDWCFLICATCQCWTMEASVHVNPPADVRGRYDIYLRGGE